MRPPVGCVKNLFSRADALASSSARSSYRKGHHLLSLVAFSLLIALCGCSGAQVIDSFTRDYRDAAASVGDSQLLLNILRAKDDLPIHFSDLSVVNGSLQWAAGATAAVPLAQNGSMTPSTLTPAISAQNSPSFGLGTLDTQDFTRGMLTPIDPQIIKQLFDQGVDPRLLMILFFSEYRDRSGRVFQNNMSCDFARAPNADGECYNRIYDYLGEIDSVFYRHGLAPAFSVYANRLPTREHHLYANVYVALRPVGGELSGPWSLKDNLGDLRQLDPTKYRLIDAREAELAGLPREERTPSYKRLYLVSEPRIAICYERKNYLRNLFPSPGGDIACRNREVILHDSPSESGTFAIRSPYQVIQFLGQVLRFQEEKRVNRCLTLSSDQRFCDTGEVIFQVNSLVGSPVVATRYASGTYTVNYRTCDKEHTQPCDYSLQVLAILGLLLNYNKAAKDIIAIPRVQVVP